MMKKTLKKGVISVDGNVAYGSEWVKNNQEIVLHNTIEKAPKAFDLKLNIIFEDDDMAVIVKPAGIAVSGNKFNTIVNALQGNIEKSKNNNALPYPRPVHRLDSQTSGLLLIAKTQLATLELGKQFKNKSIKKRYRAILIGDAPEQIVYKTKIENKISHSDLIKVKTTIHKQLGTISLVDLFPHTGRTHQLRIHTSENNIPILGDKLYGGDNNKQKKGLFLSAVEISFQHPATKKEMNFSINQPKKFDMVLGKD